MDINRWAYQIDYYETIKDDVYNGKVKDHKALKDKDYMDLERRNEEQLNKNPIIRNSLRKYLINTKKYA